MIDERAYAAAWRRHRIEVDGWGGNTWSTPSRSSVHDGTIALIIDHMDGAPCYMSFLRAVEGPDDAQKAEAIIEMRKRGFFEVLGYKKGHGDLLDLTDAAYKWMDTTDQFSLF